MDTLTSEQLMSRGGQIQKLLRPISMVKTGPAWQHRSSSYECVFGTHDGSRPMTGHRDWRFTTKSADYSANYYERWVSEHANGNWCLSQAYLTIFKQEAFKDEREFLCLHCDPLTQDNEAHAEYKKGPHIHVRAAEESLRHAHIALHCGQLDEVLSSPENLTTALANAILMISREVLDSSRASQENS